MKTLLAVLAGGVIGGIVTMFGGFVLGDALGVSQAEGAYAMQVAFFMTPIGAVVGAVLGAWLARRR